jgi:hypothetical protein
MPSDLQLVTLIFLLGCLAISIGFVHEIATERKLHQDTHTPDTAAAANWRTDSAVAVTYADLLSGTWSANMHDATEWHYVLDLHRGVRGQ